MTKCPRSLSLALRLTACLVALPVGALVAQAPHAHFDATSATATWTTSSDHGGALLRVSGPAGIIERRLEAGTSLTLGIEDFLDLANGAASDGAYNWELSFQRVSGNESVVKTRATDGGDRPSRTRNESEDSVLTGVFSFRDGAFLAPTEEAEAGPLVTKAAIADQDEPRRDQVINDDLIVDASACVGTDCVNGESFGFDTLRLKENNLRIKFQDTSNSASFPSTDWQITANDSANGGANKFSIDDIDAGRTPFTIEASAPSHSLYVDDAGRIGLGTSTPVVEAHIKDGDTPTLRLEQDGSSGFAQQTWDVAGNETNFFVRDVSNGSTLPLRIRPGAPTSSLDVDTNGDVGAGTSSPAASLHVRRTDGSAALLVQETNAASEKRNLLTLENSAGGVQFALVDAANARRWNFAVLNSGSFSTSLDGSGGPELEIKLDGRVKMGPGGAGVFDLAPNGNLAISGTLSQGSSRAIKDVVASVSPLDILSRVAALPLSKWTYKNDTTKSVHLGPMAEDFYAAFELGADALHIAPGDLAAVALAAIKGLQAEVDEREARIEELEQRLLRLEALLPAAGTP